MRIFILFKKLVYSFIKYEYYFRLPFKNEYQNFGIMQAMDILNAIFYIKENSPFKLMRGGGY
ncbi:DUF2920 family protein [Campylobacter jejuni]|uniref:DUF2920 family protein n=1 Tax=Campylobacter jejuni TaxID=197 RepID=UPI00339BEB63